MANILTESDALILHGMQKRILQDHDLSELRQFAHEFDKLPHVSGYDLTASNKIYSNQDLTKAGLLVKYPFLSCLGTPTAIEKSNIVCVVAGRPLRGVYIAANGTEINSSIYSSTETLRASDDIIFVVRN
jgi:hypothetical protein